MSDSQEKFVQKIIFIYPVETFHIFLNEINNFNTFWNERTFLAQNSNWRTCRMDDF